MVRGGAFTGTSSGGRWGLLAWVIALITYFTAPAHAQSDWTEGTTVVAEPSEKSVRWREVWAGVDVTEDGWLAFSGLTIAPFSHIHEQGLRLRIATGTGQYRYTGQRGMPYFNPALARIEERGELTRFEADTGFAEVLIGYLWRFDPLIVKLFAGAAGSGHAIAPFDAENLAVGLDWGPKVKTELWLNMGEKMWGSFDASWTSAHEAVAFRSRIGFRPWAKMSVGLEGRLDFDIQGRCDMGWDESQACREQFRADNELEADLLDYSRAGAFLRFAWEGGEISASGGVSGSSLGRASFEAPNPYATMTWITQY